MKCFVIALDSEAQSVLNNMKITGDAKRCGKRVVTGELYGETVAVIVCGVGKVNAACGTQFAVDAFKAEEIVNVGVAGGLNESVKIAHIYAISAAVQYDFDLVQLNGAKIGTLNECAENYLPLSRTTRFPERKLGTGDRFNDSPQDYRLLTEELGADIRDMEGAAIAQACMHAGVKCRIYKAVSDVYGSGSTTEQFKANLAKCADSLARGIKDIMEDGEA